MATKSLTQATAVPASFAQAHAVAKFATPEISKTFHSDIWRNSVKDRKGVRVLRIRIRGGWWHTNNIRQYHAPESHILDPIIAYAQANLPANSWFVGQNKWHRSLYVFYDSQAGHKHN